MTAHAWLAAIAVALVGAVIRLVNLSWPGGEVFDEVHYVGDAGDLFAYGVEWDTKNNWPAYVVHPPLGKWLIGAGMKLFGYNSFGWRIAAALAGVLTILMLTRIAHRLFGSLLLACAAGLLMAFDGMHFVLSRSALLDIFLMFFVLAAFGALVLDRDQRRRRWSAFTEAGGDPSGRGVASRPPFAVPWWRLASAVLLGAATGVKWSALAFLPAFLILVLWWEIGVRRRHGVRRPVRDAFIDEFWWLLACLGVVVLTYLATWSGWLATDSGYFRHWLRDQGRAEPFVLGPLRNLVEYHYAALQFHLHLSEPHSAAASAWTWLVLGHPVPFYLERTIPCGATDCVAQIILLGTPLLWWSFLPALAVTLWFGIARRDWRAGAILVMAGFAIVPWFFFSSRTMFYFYALPAEPFLILAVVFALGALASTPRGVPLDISRLQVGAVLAGAFVILVVLNFAYFFPIYTGDSIPTVDWARRMWLGSRWT